MGHANQADGAKPTQCTLTPPPCPQYDAAYYCKNMSDYSYCGNWATSVHLSDQNYCQIDTSQLGPQAAQTVKSYLDTLSTANRCTVGGQGRSQAAINQTGMVNGANLRNMAPSIAWPSCDQQPNSGRICARHQPHRGRLPARRTGGRMPQKGAGAAESVAVPEQ